MHAAEVNSNISEMLLVLDMYIYSLSKSGDPIMGIQREGGGRNKFAFLRVKSDLYMQPK
jgi:hypothetical protein